MRRNITLYTKANKNKLKSFLIFIVVVLKLSKRSIFPEKCLLK